MRDLSLKFPTAADDHHVGVDDDDDDDDDLLTTGRVHLSCNNYYHCVSKTSLSYVLHSSLQPPLVRTSTDDRVSHGLPQAQDDLWTLFDRDREREIELEDGKKRPGSSFRVPCPLD